MNENILNNLDDIFDDCLEAVLSGHSTVEACLERHPAYAVELKGLLQTAMALAESPELAPSAAARMRIRVALNDRMAQWSKPQPKPFWRIGWANTLATFIIGLSLTGGGLAYTASGSMPGEALYPLKLSIEQTMVSFVLTDDARVNFYAALNERRVEEIVYLASIGDSFGIVELTGRIQDNFTAASNLKGSQNNLDSGMTITSSFPETSQLPPDRNDIKTVATGSALNTSLTNSQTDQINALSNISGISPAVQQALAQAEAVLRAGYDTLLANTP